MLTHSSRCNASSQANVNLIEHEKRSGFSCIIIAVPICFSKYLKKGSRVFSFRCCPPYLFIKIFDVCDGKIYSINFSITNIKNLYLNSLWLRVVGWLVLYNGSMSIQDKVTIVTGAGLGIGRATALRFARAGARLPLFALPPQTMDDPPLHILHVI